MAFKKIIDTRNITIMTNLKKSQGNFLVDSNKKKYLDMYGNIGSLPLGYNHPKLKAFLNDTSKYEHLLIHRPALGVNPPIEWENEIEKFYKNYCPSNLDFMFIGCGCGSGANENAFKATFLHYARNNFSEHKLSNMLKSSLNNEEPGSPNLSILSFRKGFHGRTLGCLSTTRSNPFHKINVPAFKWPVAPFPQYKYNIVEEDYINSLEDDKCLDIIQQILLKNKTIAGIIVEPIQAEGGDRFASNYFFRELQALSYDYNKTLIVDEVQTGCGSTGKLWAHEYWENSDISNFNVMKPDIVTFSKKTQVAGYFCKKEYKSDSPYQLFNTWMGDPFKIILSNKIYGIIQEDNLLEKSIKVGKYMLNQLNDVKNKTKKISNIRGKGLFIAFDYNFNSIATLKNRLIQNGVNIGTCGKNSIRLRPSLTLDYKDVDYFILKLKKSL